MADEYFRRQMFPLRLSPTMRHQANELAHREGISLNQFISLAIAEKISRMEQQTWTRDQANSKFEGPGRLRVFVNRHA